MTTDQGAREARYAEAMSGIEVWVGSRDDAGDDIEVGGTIDRDDLRVLARAVLPLVDAEVAAAVSEAKAEIEHLHLRGSYDLAGAETRAESAEAEVKRLRKVEEGIRALADRWEARIPEDGHAESEAYGDALSECLTDARALLSPSPAATTGEDPDDRYDPDWETSPIVRPAPVSSGEAATGEADLGMLAETVVTAILTTTFGRADTELLMNPCHRRNCTWRHRTADDVVELVLTKAAERVRFAIATRPAPVVTPSAEGSA